LSVVIGDATYAYDDDGLLIKRVDAVARERQPAGAMLGAGDVQADGCGPRGSDELSLLLGPLHLGIRTLASAKALQRQRKALQPH
jgi:hypothetical protein